MAIAVTAVYAAILGIYFVTLSFYVSAVRAKTGVGLGDGGNAQMLVAMRRHGNTAEFTPFALLLMALAEAMGFGSAWLHACGVLLVAGRLIHPFGVAEDGGWFSARVIEQLATYAAIVVPGGFILWVSLS